MPSDLAVDAYPVCLRCGVMRCNGCAPAGTPAWTPTVRKRRIGWEYGLRSRLGYVSREGWWPTRQHALRLARLAVERQYRFDRLTPSTDRSQEGWR